MNGIIDATVRLIQAGKRASARKRDFFGLFVVVFFGSVLVLGQMGLLPDMPFAPAASTVALAQDRAAVTSVHTEQTTTVELPVKIEIPKINLSASIANPTTTDIAILDQGLLSGAVRYPTSAELGEDGNVVLFGHSSYLPIVGNQAYKTFDGIQKLTAGDIVTVYSSDTAYTYRVESVAKESANDAGIPLSVTGRVLTLSTCDSFGSKTDRFIVVANFVDSYSVSTSG
jgi:LPXTG-site transpeptidase (sortase) family protein